MTRAVVFGYHNVGVRCLKVLLAHGVEVPLVVTHDDSAGETIWFGSVAGTAADYGIPTIAPEDSNAADVIARVAAARPDFIFSFYYRRMLAPALLALAPRGALNMHGSLLPKYRGRAPVNWAIIHGERETGATLHYMADKPDNGDIVAQTAVPILPDDVASDVFVKVTVAAEMTLDRALPALLAGTAPRMRQDAGKGSYFGGRKPEDGVIDWSKSAIAIHNLVRAVAPPYPGCAHADRRPSGAAFAHPRARCHGAGRHRAGVRYRRRAHYRGLRRRRNPAGPRARDRRCDRRCGRIRALAGGACGGGSR